MASSSELERRPVVFGCVGLGTVVAVVVLSLAACSSDGEPAPTAAAYLSGLAAVCAGTATALGTLPDPPEGISVADFATEAGTILRGEAESVRGLSPPDDLDDDHRALIRNDEEQAAAWSDLAAAAGGPDGGADSIGELTTTIAELNLGRNDLVTDMGAPSCVRSPG